MIFELLVIYQLKHWLCDYPLQGKYMLGKFGAWPKWVLPLLAHSGMHSLFTLVIAYCVRPDLCLPLALFDGVVHFSVDRIKASPDLGGRWKNMTKGEYKECARQEELSARIMRTEPNKDGLGYELAEDMYLATQRKFKSNTYFWWALGADQMAHHLTHYVIIWQLLK